MSFFCYVFDIWVESAQAKVFDIWVESAQAKGFENK